MSLAITPRPAAVSTSTRAPSPAVGSQTGPGGRRPDQSLHDALLDLREDGHVPWDWIVDENAIAREPVPRRHAAGALCSDYCGRIAATNGQCGGFLRTDFLPVLSEGDRVLYLGDYDLAGGQIEENTRRVLCRCPTSNARWKEQLPRA
jgi:hypothetical protein